MMEYSKLVKALRCKRDDCEGCDLAFLDNDEGWICQYAAKDDDAADEIEKLLIGTDNRDAIIDKFMDEILRLRQQLPKQGEWKRVEDGETYHYECSECGERPLYSRFGYIILSGVCPFCGAKMEVEDD